MVKAEVVIKCIQEEYHLKVGEIYLLFPYLRELAEAEDLELRKRKARERRWKLIGK